MKQDKLRELFGFLCLLSEATGKPPRDVMLPALELIDLEKKQSRLNENECNRELTQREINSGERMDKRVRELAQELGAEAVLNGDPRGTAIRLKFPSGVSSGWGEGVHVP